MTIEEALAVIEQVLERGRLNKVEELVLRQSWEGLSYGEIARISGYEAGYIKDTGYKLWNILSKAYGVKVSKHNLQGVLKRALKDNLTAIQNPKLKIALIGATRSTFLSSTVALKKSRRSNTGFLKTVAVW